MNDEITPDEETEAAEAVAEETTEEAKPETVREYRHKAKSALVDARASLSLRSDATKEVYTLLNGTIETIIKGVPGLSQDQQVERLYDARQQVLENREQVVALAEAARDAVIEQVQAWPEQFAAALDSAGEVLAEAEEFAETRDFKAHMSKKRRAGRYGGYGRYGY